MGKLPLLFSLLSFALFSAALGCQTLITDEAADEKWRVDYAHCRFGMTPEQLDEYSENPDTAEAPRPRRGWQSCLQAVGWDTQARARLGPEWDD